MTDHLRLALRRNLAAAEEAGDFDRADRLRERLGDAPAPQTKAEPEPEPAPEPSPEPEPEPDALDAVSFASPAARNAADEAGMTAESFKRRRKSSDAGFTKADVERIAAAADDGDEDSVA